jgi:PAS domain S-box-containing protein
VTQGPIERLLNQSQSARVRATAGVAAVTFVVFWILDAAIEPRELFADALFAPAFHEICLRLLVTALVVLLWRASLARRRFRLVWAAIAAAPDGIQITDLDGTIAFSNPTVQAISGFAPQELRGRNMNELNADPTLTARVILPAIRKSGSWTGEMDVRHKDGHVVPVWLTTSIVKDRRGRPLAAVGVLRDMSERKRIERETWEYARRLEEATGLKDLFADILRHDLLGPAATVQLSLDSLLRREPEPAAARKILETAKRSCSKLIDLIEGAAKYAKLSTAQGVDFQTLDLTVVMGDVLSEFETRAKERGLKVLIDAPGTAWIRGNPMIADVFENLLSNAAKYGPEGGTIWVRIDDDGARWRASITDSGEGIPDADKDRVFRRFERLSKGSVKGTGLGLAIAQRIVDLHGGRIWVEDAPGRGARFCVTLSKAAPPATPAVVPQSGDHLG